MSSSFMGKQDSQISVIACPACGASITLDEGVTSFVCPYCGVTLRLKSEPAEPAGIAPTGIDADGTIRDWATGYGLFCGEWPTGWSVTGTSLRQTGSLSRPYLPHVELHAPEGAALLCVEQGDAGQRESGGMRAVMAMYGQAAAPYDSSNKAEMPDPLAVADAHAAQLTGGTARFERQLVPPRLADAQARALRHYQEQGRSAGIPVADPFGAQVLRIYSFETGGTSCRAAVFVEQWAAKGGLGGAVESLASGASDIADRLGGMLGGLGAQARSAAAQAQGDAAQAQEPASQAQSALKDAASFFMGGGLIGKKLRESRVARQQSTATTASPQAAIPASSPQTARMPDTQTQPSDASTAQGSAWCVPDFAQYVQGGTIYWSIDRIIALLAPADGFDELLRSVFLPVVGSVWPHADLASLARQAADRENAAIMANTQQAVAASNARFQAQQAAHRQQQAAFNAYNDSISAARDARQASFRASTNAAFGGASAGGAGDFSEAIRGVNSYVTSDGRTVEVSVHADRAYENQAGDVVGTSGGADLGGDWTELPRV